MFSRGQSSSEGERNGVLKVTNFPPETINGWTVTALIPPIVRKYRRTSDVLSLHPSYCPFSSQINESHVYDYCESKSAQPPTIQVSVQANQGDAHFTDSIRHTLQIEGITTEGYFVINTSLSEILHGEGQSIVYVSIDSLIDNSSTGPATGGVLAPAVTAIGIL